MKKLWLDLELRADIDDYITLVMALEMKEANVEYISIHNPSILEINLLKNTISKYYDLKIIYKLPILVLSGVIENYPESRDINKSLFSLSENKKTDLHTIQLEKVINDISNKELKELTYFTGGSLYTLSMIMRKEKELTAYIQGGYAGSNIVNKEDILEKFHGKESVPSWNVNLDLESTNEVLSNSESTLHFISKNICHSSIVSLEDIGTRTSLGIDILKNYYADKPKKMTFKAMHDVLAFITIFNKDVVIFKKVNLSSFKRKGKMNWKSDLNNDSNISISVAFDIELFKQLFFDSFKI